MHVGQINTNREWGGGENQVLHLVQALHERGVKVTLLAHAEGELLRRAQESGLPAAALPVGLGGGVSRARTASLVQELGVDLLHVHDSRGGTLGAWLGRRLGLPVVLSRRVASPLRRNLFSRYKYSRRNFRAVLAISETVRDVFLQGSQFAPEDVYVVPSGVEIGELDAVERDVGWRRSFGGAYLVGGVGKLSVKKNWQFLVRVAARMAQQGDLDIQWIIAGDGDEHDNLVELIRELGVEDRVHLLGFRKDAVRILKSLDVLFFPSLIEGASVTVRECMVLGTPVVAVDAAGTMESLAGHGWGVSAADVDGAVQAVEQALLDTDLRDKHVAGARRYAIEHYTYDRTAIGTLAVYREILGADNGKN